MGWLSSFFSSTKGQALSSTHDAFSLPTSSPTIHQHPDAFNPETLQTPDPSSYTYPPQVYAYVPSSAGPTSASILPTHHDQRLPYPPLANTWNRLRTWLNREYPELGDTLNYGILPFDLAQIEMQFGFSLPPAIRESYLCVDGQEAESAAGCSEGLFFGLKLLPLEDVLQEWRFWREVDEDPATGANVRLREEMQSIPPGYVRREYSQRGWIPLIADKVGNYVGIDLNPDQSGSPGQVIVFGRDFDTKVVLWRGDGPGGWAKWLASFVEELESGDGIEVGNSGEGSEDSEDDLGYESYFYDGTGRGQGDGGGDTGNSGLRLTGEYRGWNVLEAWADRSLRRWHEAGVIPDTSLLPPEQESKANITHESSAEVGIPILADVDQDIPAPTVALGLAAQPPPTISVTRAPAPRPVELPLPSDILPPPTPESSQSSFDEDLESGRSTGMRNRDVAQTSRAASPRSASASSGSVLVGPAPAQRSKQTTPAPAPASASSSTPQPQPQPDLLADSAPAMDAKPISPSSSEPPAVEEQVAVVEQEEEEREPDTTIRLVGGGGVAGVAVPEQQEVVVDGDTTAEKAEPEPEPESEMEKGAKSHKKTKSGLAGLKKNFGLGRKQQDSAGSESAVAAT
ncbi:hypothetical protein H0H92_012518 [Tricholoma furcatifolium]|nr:hypothetical protein H0H92_012518 [Tricholoma furcatifolium]